MRTMLPTLKLSSSTIHLWFSYPTAIRDQQLINEYIRLLNPAERIQWQRFRFAHLRHQYLITRALVRSTLSRYTDVIKPDAWCFSKNKYGRPEILTTANIPPLRFNLSHTSDLIICGIVLQQDIGVDVENIKRKNTSINIADRFFSSQEIKDLHSVPEEKRLARFYDYWTLKESYIKARGMGLSLPLEHFTFHLSDHTEPLKISFAEQINDKPAHWQFWLLQPTQHHKVAVSIQQEAKVEHKLKFYNVVPLMEEQTFFCPILNCSKH